eukprot:765655-Amphidinium_carterae.1
MSVCARSGLQSQSWQTSLPWKYKVRIDAVAMRPTRELNSLACYLWWLDFWIFSVALYKQARSS